MKSVPEGFHTITPYITFKDAGAAIALYKKAFGAKEDNVMRSKDGKIVHACITIGNSKVFLADECPEMGNVAPRPEGASVGFYLYVDNADSAYKQALAS